MYVVTDEKLQPEQAQGSVYLVETKFETLSMLVNYKHELDR